MTTVLLKFNDGWFGLLSFLEKNNFLSQFVGIWIETHFPLKCHFIFFRSSFEFFAEKVISWTTEKREVLSADGLGSENNFQKGYY